MKKINKKSNPRSQGMDQLDALREKLHKSIATDGSSWQLNGLDRIFALVQMDPAAFHRQWVEPLLAAGVSVDVAYACIAQSCFRPN